MGRVTSFSEEKNFPSEELHPKETTSVEDGFFTSPKGTPLAPLPEKLYFCLKKETAHSFQKAPLLQMTSTVFDFILPDPKAFCHQLVNLLDTDTLCFRQSHPLELATLQKEKWDPALQEVSNTIGAPILYCTDSFSLQQPEETRRAMGDYLAKKSPLQLGALKNFHQVCHSLILSLGVLEELFLPEIALNLSLLEETYQKNRWGHDEEAIQRQDMIEQNWKTAILFWESI